MRLLTHVGITNLRWLSYGLGQSNASLKALINSSNCNAAYLQSSISPMVLPSWKTSTQQPWICVKKRAYWCRPLADAASVQCLLLFLIELLLALSRHLLGASAPVLNLAGSYYLLRPRFNEHIVQVIDLFYIYALSQSQNGTWVFQQITCELCTFLTVVIVVWLSSIISHESLPCRVWRCETNSRVAQSNRLMAEK